MENVSIRPAFLRVDRRIKSAQLTNLVIPGDEITTDKSFTRGHGVYMQDEKILASVAGTIDQVNRLITVRPLKARYIGSKGDVVVGRVIEVGQKRWKVDIKSTLDAILNLSAVNLPSGEQRRKCDEDEKWMRQYLSEGDLISAEVMDVNSFGVVNLQIRSNFYGKLGQGTLISVPPSLIKKRKSHFHSLSVGASIILGNNGYIWIYPLTPNTETSRSTDVEQNLQPVTKYDREIIARLRNCIQVLADHQMMLFDTSVIDAYEVSSEHEVKNILKMEVAQEIANMTRHKLSSGYMD